MILVSQATSVENGANTNGLPAKRMILIRSHCLSDMNSLSTFFAISIRLGVISSASIERDTSTTRTISCGIGTDLTTVSSYIGLERIAPMERRIKNLSPQRKRNDIGRRRYFGRISLGGVYPKRSRKKIYHASKKMGTKSNMNGWVNDNISIREHG